MDNIHASKYYVDYWAVVAENILKWSESEYIAFVCSWQDYLDTGKGGFYHELPCVYIAPQVVKKYNIVQRNANQTVCNLLDDALGAKDIKQVKWELIIDALLSLSRDSP